MQINPKLTQSLDNTSQKRLPGPENGAQDTKTVREPLTTRLKRKGALVANDNEHACLEKRTLGRFAWTFVVNFLCAAFFVSVFSILALDTGVTIYTTLVFAFILACLMVWIPIMDASLRSLAAGVAAAFGAVLSIFS